ncbi:phosphorylase family protein [Corallococcus exiguus]|uniref:Response regulatory domain-containing protein n=1 Tax=Corallococcus exiguus TaxID=83462 RepID=A0A7X5BSC6_9BACT|nr:response regulator [Corallococcus exiguus]NBC40018.1 hypothetical protein [Corallococcus exiguus]TNV60573.1 response regulator [Corallococcus exiguus]
MKIIIIEDNNEKRIKISQALTSIDGIAISNIEYAGDIFSAKRRLESTRFDLMILDIALPLRGDKDPDENAGFALLDELLTRTGSYHLPAHIIGITGHEKILKQGTLKFSSKLLTLVYFEFSSDEWQLALQARVRQILASIVSKASEPAEYRSDLAIVCALYSPELTNILALPWNWKQISISGDHTIYWSGQYFSNGQPRTVHAAFAARMGMPAASILATKMIHTFRPRFICMTGIAAGVKERINLGDLLVSNPSWDWGSGKWISEKSVAKFLPAPHQIPLDVSLRDKFKLLSQDTALLSEIRNSYPAERPPFELSLRVGPIASGASVLADRQTSTRILSQHRELLGIDMEAYGVLAAAEEASEPRPDAFVVKSIVDFADGEKNDRYQSYAGFVSARITGRFAERFL